MKKNYFPLLPLPFSASYFAKSSAFNTSPVIFSSSGNSAPWTFTKIVLSKGPGFAALNSPKRNTQIYLTDADFTNTAKGIRGVLVGTERENNTDTLIGPNHIWAQIVDGNGKPIGKPIQILSVPDSGWIYSHVGAMPSLPTDSSFRFAAFESILSADPHIAKLLLKLTTH